MDPLLNRGTPADLVRVTGEAFVFQPWIQGHVVIYVGPVRRRLSS